MELHVLGAGLDVGRSCFILTIGKHRLLLDCGAHHSFDDHRRFPDFAALSPDILSSLTAILISHFHFDHVAALPLLTERLACPAPVYMTTPTRDLTRLLLADVVTTSASRGQHCPYSHDDVENSLSRALDLPVGRPIQLAPGLSVTAYDAGHALGATMLFIRAGERSLLYSGDYAARPDRHLRPARLPFGLCADVFVTEATYAAAARPPGDPAAALTAAVAAAVAKGGRVLVPVSAFGRVHAVCAALESAGGRTALRGVPLYLASGLASRALAVYSRHEKWTVPPVGASECAECSGGRRRRSRFADGEAVCPHGLLERLRPFTRNEHWDTVVHGPGPVVLFATPGSMSTGLSRDVLREWAGGRDNVVVVPGACFATAVAGNALTSIDGGPPVRCQLVNLALQCHVDGPEIVRMCHHVAAKSVVLVHGEKARTLKFRDVLTEELGVPCFAPPNGEVLKLDDDLFRTKSMKIKNEDRKGDVSMNEEHEEGLIRNEGLEEEGDIWANALREYERFIQEVG